MLASSNAGVVVILIGLYFVPTIVGAIRKVPNIGSVIVINIFLGFTLVGWVVALAMAARSQPPAPANQQVVIQHYSGHGMMPAQMPGAMPSQALPPHPNAIAASTTPASWIADPTGRHQLRYWNGSEWTNAVSNGGVQSTDPL
jgi:hypothetical protein